MYYFLTLIAAIVGFALIVFLRYLWIRLGFKDRNYTQVQRSFRANPQLDSSAGFLEGSKVYPSDQQDTDRAPVRKTRRYRPFQTTADIKRSYIVDAILDKPRWRQEWEDRDW